MHDELRRQHRPAEKEAVERLLALQPDAATSRRITGEALRLAQRVRAAPPAALSAESFLRHYGISTREGVALMCVAEALLRLLAAGRAVMVTDQVRELDLPDTVVARTSLDGDEDGLFCDVMDLLRSPDRRQRLEKNARDYVRAEHSPDAMFEDYARCLEEAERLPSPSIELPRHLS